MKTKRIILIFALLSVALFSVSLSACGKEEDKITFKTLTLNGNTAYGKVSNDTETFSFLQEITAHGNASYQVYKEITCETLFKSKTIDLKEGDNTVYVLQTVGEEMTLYTVTVRRRPMHTISFDTSGLFDIDDLIVEEDSFIQEPTIDIDSVIRGYGFIEWNFDFSKPVTESAVLTGILIAKPEMENFVFTSTAESCVITGIKDNSVTQISVPDYVTEIADGAFSGCGNLKEITIPFVGAVAGKTENDTYQYPFGYIFGSDSYTGGTETEQYYYGSSISSFTSTVYYIPSSLKKVTVTGGNILYGAFYNCSSLVSINIPDGVTSIGDNAFSYCNLLQYNLLDDIKYLGSKSNPYVIVMEVADMDLTSFSIDNKAKIIYNRAFSGCSKLTSITIPDDVTSIGVSAFAYCSSLKSVKIGNSVKSIGYDAFYNCSSLRHSAPYPQSF